MNATEELWALIESSGASGLCSKLLHGLPIQDMEPLFRCAKEVVDPHFRNTIGWVDPQA